jgi:hypothetical protein
LDPISYERNASPAKLDVMGIFDWPVWEKDVSTFPWTYTQQETCYFLAGEVVVTPEGGEPVTLRKGDLVVFPAGLRCTWEIRAPVRKHYQFG